MHSSDSKSRKKVAASTDSSCGFVLSREAATFFRYRSDGPCEVAVNYEPACKQTLLVEVAFFFCNAHLYTFADLETAV